MPAYDVLYTSMTPNGLKDVYLKDLQSHTEPDTESKSEYVALFRQHLTAVYNLAPTEKSSDWKEKVHAMFDSVELMDLQKAIPLLPVHLRPIKTDPHSLVEIAIRYHVVQVMSIGLRNHL